MDEFIELTTNEDECRICFEPQTFDNKLIKPCACNGTSGYVHELCLKEWRKTADNPQAKIQCMECKEFYTIIKTYSDEKPFCNIAIVPFGFLYLGFLMSISYTIGLIELINLNFTTSNTVITFQKQQNTSYDMMLINYPILTTTYYVTVTQFFIHNLIMLVNFLYIVFRVHRKWFYFKNIKNSLMFNTFYMFYPQTIYYLANDSNLFFDYLTIANGISIIFVLYFYKHHLFVINDMNVNHNNEIVLNYNCFDMDV